MLMCGYRWLTKRIARWLSAVLFWLFFSDVDHKLHINPSRMTHKKYVEAFEILPLARNILRPHVGNS